MYKLGDDIEKIKDFEKVKQAIDRLCDSDVVSRLKGNCIGASDIIQNLLSFYGVKSKQIECQLFAVKENDGNKDFCFVGFNNIGLNPNSVDTHVVVVTETEIPILIDCSIGHLLPESEQIIVRKLSSLDPEKLGEYKVDDIFLQYFHKKNIKLPALHQKNIIERINDDKVTKEKLQFITKALIFLGCFSTINFILNVSMILIKLYMG
jgi:hypothetical protein